MQKVQHKVHQRTIRPRGFNAYAFFMDWLLVTEDLLKELDKDELEAIVAHEFSHIFNRHVLTQFATLLIFYGPFFFLSLPIKYSPEEIFNSLTLSFLYLVSFIWFLIGLRGANWVSTKQESYADIQALYITRKPEALKRALLKLKSKGMKTDKRPTRLSKIFESFDWVVRYFFGFSHPPVAERIEYIER